MRKLSLPWHRHLQTDVASCSRRCRVCATRPNLQPVAFCSCRPKDSIRINRYTLLLVTGVIQLAAAFSRTLSIILLPGILAEFSSPELAEQKQLGSTSGLDRPLLLACGWSHTRNPCAMGQGLSQSLACWGSRCFTCVPRLRMDVEQIRSVQCCQQEQLKRLVVFRLELLFLD